jgi:hypothetical protein
LRIRSAVRRKDALTISVNFSAKLRIALVEAAAL